MQVTQYCGTDIVLNSKVNIHRYREVFHRIMSSIHQLFELDTIIYQTVALASGAFFFMSQ